MTDSNQIQDLPSFYHRVLSSIQTKVDAVKLMRFIIKLAQQTDGDTFKRYLILDKNHCNSFLESVEKVVIKNE